MIFVAEKKISSFNTLRLVSRLASAENHVSKNLNENIGTSQDFSFLIKDLWLLVKKGDN